MSRSLLRFFALLIPWGGLLVASPHAPFAAVYDPTWILVNAPSDTLLARANLDYIRLFPLYRSGPVDVFDTRRDRFMVLEGSNFIHGGPGYYFYYSPPEVLTLDFSGSRRWEAQLPPSAPELRAAAAVYDSVDDQVLVFGGATPCLCGQYTPITVLDSTLFAFRPATTTWSDITPASGSPDARQDHAMVLDPTRHELVVFGGYGKSGHPTADVWTYGIEAGAWTQLVPTGGPPPARMTCFAAYDTDSDRVWIAGGIGDGNVALSDVWVLDRSPSPAWRQMPSSSGLCAGSTRGFFDGREHRLVAIALRDSTLISTRSTLNPTADWEPTAAVGRAPPWDRVNGTIAWNPHNRWVVPIGFMQFPSGPPDGTYAFALDPVPVLHLAPALDSVSFHRGVTTTHWSLVADGPLMSTFDFVLSSPGLPDQAGPSQFPSGQDHFTLTDTRPTAGRTVSYRLSWFDGLTMQTTGPFAFDTPPDPVGFVVTPAFIGLFNEFVTATFNVLGDSTRLLTPSRIQARVNAGPWNDVYKNYPDDASNQIGFNIGSYPGNGEVYDFRVVWGDSQPPRQSATYTFADTAGMWVTPTLTYAAAGWNEVLIRWKVPRGSKIRPTVFLSYYNGNFPLDTLAADTAGVLTFDDTRFAPGTDYTFVLGWPMANGFMRYGDAIPLATRGDDPLFVAATASTNSIRTSWKLATGRGYELRLLRHEAAGDVEIGQKPPDANGDVVFLDSGLQPDHPYVYIPVKVTSLGWGTYQGVTARTKPPGTPDTTGVAFSLPMPNPASDQVRFSLTVGTGTTATLELFDASGRRVWSRNLTSPGAQDVIVDLTGLRTGLYIARLSQPGFSQRHRLAVVR